jgi:hypothetical protein
MSRHPLLLSLLVAACATESSAPSGTVARVQKDYLQALEACQEKHRWDASVDAGMGAVPTAEDGAFSECVAPANSRLEQQMRETHFEDAGSAGPG